jgi:DNA-binding GntR family transcriptional regulator
MARGSSQRRHKLANQILDVVREARFEPGHHLREQALGDLLQVSRTPIRSALQLLAERGILEARRNHGYFLLARPEELYRLELEVPSTSDQDLYALIVQDRLVGRLPVTFIQSDIARRYEVDRAALQRTLLRLLDDGLIHRNTGRGWSFVPTLDTRIGMHGSYAFRSIIEPAILRLQDFRADAAMIERSRLQHLYLVAHPAIETVDRAQLFETDAQFHEMLAEFGGNPFFLQAIQQQNRMRRLLEFGGYVNRRRVKDWCREHLAILDAVGAGAREKAAQMMGEHLKNAFAAVPNFSLEDRSPHLAKQRA